MVQGFDRELEKALRDAGCTLQREAKGSHTIWYSRVSEQSFAVPQGTQSRYAANAVLKQADLPMQF